MQTVSYEEVVRDFMSRYYSDMRTRRVRREMLSLYSRLEAALRNAKGLSYEDIELALLDSGYSLSGQTTRYVRMILAILSPDLDPIAREIIRFLEKVKRASIREIKLALGLYGDIRVYVYRAMVIDRRLKGARAGRKNFVVYLEG